MATLMAVTRPAPRRRVSRSLSRLEMTVPPETMQKIMPE